MTVIAMIVGVLYLAGAAVTAFATLFLPTLFDAPGSTKERDKLVLAFCVPAACLAFLYAAFWLFMTRSFWPSTVVPLVLVGVVGALVVRSRPRYD